MFDEKLKDEFLENPSTDIENKSNEIGEIKNFLELNNILKCIKKENYLKYVYNHRKSINNILEFEDKCLEIPDEAINDNGKESYFLLFGLIAENRYIFNYSYNFDVVEKLYNKMKKEKNNLSKFILYIIAYLILYNFDDNNNCQDLSKGKKIENIYQEIDKFIIEQQKLVNYLQLNLNVKDYKTFNINEIYSQIIITLIKNKKLSDFEYSKNIMEQLDLENIELTDMMYIQLKNEFDENSNKEYINSYRIIKYENLFNEANINFYYFLLKYVFKADINICNIKFLLETKHSINCLIKNNFSRLLSDLGKLEEDLKERLIYDLKSFIDKPCVHLSKIFDFKLLANKNNPMDSKINVEESNYNNYEKNEENYNDNSVLSIISNENSEIFKESIPLKKGNSYSSLNEKSTLTESSFFSTNSTEVSNTIDKSNIIEEPKEQFETEILNCNKKIEKIKRNKKGKFNLELDKKANIVKKKSKYNTNLIIKEENVELENEDMIDINELIFNTIKNRVKIILKQENGEKIILIRPFINNGLEIYKYHFNKCKEHYSNKPESDEFIIFDFLDDFISKLTDEYNNNYKLIIEITIIKKNENEFLFKYKFEPPDKKSPKYYIDFNYLSKGFYHLIEEINKEKYKHKCIDQRKYNKNNKARDITRILKNNSDNNEVKVVKNKGYKILYHKKLIKDFNNNSEYGMKRAEFIVQFNDSNKKFICGDNTGQLEIISSNYFVKKELQIKSNSTINSISERINTDGKYAFYACANKKFINYEFDEIFKNTYPNLDDNDESYFSSLEMRKDKKIHLIIAGNGGVTDYINPFNFGSEKVSIIRGLSCTGLIQIDDNLIAFTSNKIIPNGEDNLYIYDFNKKRNKLIDKQSFIASPHGLSIFTIENENQNNQNNENYLICACKKYLDEQVNGILLVNIKNDYSTYFLPTDEFEVYCICQICEEQTSGYMLINQRDKGKGTEFFLAGGFDKIKRQGKIKLFKLYKNKKSGETKIIFLQDIEFENNIVPPSKNTHIIKEESYLEKSETTVETTQNIQMNESSSIFDRDENNLEIFKGFDGAVTSIIQAESNFDILVSCADGKINLFSKPDLQIYGKFLKYNN